MTSASSTPKPRVTVALIGHTANSDNLGLGALTVAEIDILRGIARAQDIDLRIRVIDWKLPRTPYVGGPDIDIVEIKGRDLVDPRGIFAQYLKSDLVIDIGAGDSFSDIYGWPRLRRFFAMKYLAHLSGRPVVLAPQTAGPFKSRAARLAALMHVRLCRIVCTRDALSTEHLREIGFRGDVITASDLALRLPYTPPAPREDDGSDDGKVRVGLNVSGLLMNGGYTRSNMFGLSFDYAEMIDTLVRDLTARPEVELHLVSHVLTHKPGQLEDDQAAGAALAERHPGVVLAPAFASPEEAKSYIAGMDFFMGSRMHATIAAFSSGVPVIPLAYSRKFAGLFGALGYDRTLDCTTDSIAGIRAKAAQGYEDRATLRTEVAAAMAQGEALLGRYTDALEALITKIANRRRG